MTERILASVYLNSSCREVFFIADLTELCEEDLDFFYLIQDIHGRTVIPKREEITHGSNSLPCDMGSR